MAQNQTLLLSADKLQAFMQELNINLPEGSTMNSMLTEKGGEFINEYISEEIKLEKQKLAPKPKTGLIVHSEQKVSFETEKSLFEVLGRIPADFSELRVSLHITEKSTGYKHRFKVDLYDYSKVENLCNNLHEKQGFNFSELEKDLLKLTGLLEEHREKLFQDETKGYLQDDLVSELTPKAERQAINMLSDKNLLKRIDSLIESSGVVGEENVRLAMFIVASSYKMPYPMHCLIQGESGGGKSHLINTISSAMPQEDVLDMTRITPKSLYNYHESELLSKVFVIQDFDGIGEEAQLAFRELQSLGYINSSSTKKDRYGNNIAVQYKVKAHFSSLVATTKAGIYYDNMSRSIVFGIDESPEQTERIIEAQNNRLAGLTNESETESASLMLRNILRVLKPYPVKNSFAQIIKLPVESKMKRRLNQQFQSFVAQITLLHQYQRKIDEDGRLITTIEDVKLAIEQFFTPIFLKIDELDSSTRQFFEQLKTLVKEKFSMKKFTQRDVRLSMSYAKTRISYFFKRLLELEYIQIIEGSKNRGFKYQITHWDDLESFKAKIKEQLLEQLNNCRNESEN